MVRSRDGSGAGRHRRSNVAVGLAFEQQAKLLELSLEPVLVWELNGPIIYWNAGAESLYGYAAAQAVGRRSHELWPRRRSCRMCRLTTYSSATAAGWASLSILPATDVG